MTIEIQVVCDGKGCGRSQEIEDNTDSDVEREEWVVHPLDGYQHFCPACWPEAKKQIDE